MDSILNKNLQKRDKVSIISSLCSFVLGYVYLYISLSLNPDNVGTYFNGNNSGLSVSWYLQNGRWMKSFVDFFSQLIGYNNLIPFAIFIILLIITSFFTLFIIRLFDIKNIFLCFFISSIFFLTPSFVEIFSYFNDAFTHGIGILLSFASIYTFIIKKKILISSIFSSMAIGIYQSYFCFIYSIIIIYFIYSNYFIENNNKKKINDLIKIILSSLLSFIIYFLINKVCLYLFDIQNSALQGRFLLSSINFTFIIKGIIKAYGMIFILPFVSYAGINTTIIMKLIFFIFLLLSFYILFKIFFSLKNNDKIILLISILVLPLYMNAIALLPHTTIRMTFGLGLIYLLHYYIIL